MTYTWKMLHSKQVKQVQKQKYSRPHWAFGFGFLIGVAVTVGLFIWI